MKKFTKEQLENTYIVNDCPVKRAAYKRAMESVGIYGVSPHTFSSNEHEFLGVFCGKVYRSNAASGLKQLHLSDLIELENGKVYTTDPEVVRKYAELCGSKVRIGSSAMHGGAIGAKFGDCYVFTFAAGGTADNSNCHEITVDQINALHREQFPEQYKVKQKPHTRVEYVKLEFEHAWEAVKAFEEGEELYTNVSNDTYSKLDTAPDVLKYLYRLYRRVEKEVDWRDELRASLGEGFGIHNSEHSVGSVGFDGLYTKSNAVKLAKAILRATGELPG